MKINEDRSSPLGVKSEPNDAVSFVQVQGSPHAWACKKCPEVFDTSTLLRRHRKTHRKQESYFQYSYRFDEKRGVLVCKTCDLELADRDEMEKHVIVHEDKFACDICKQEFVKPYEYSCHVYSHDQTKDFCCPLCKFTTSNRTTILKHINSFHLGRYIYTCAKCGKGFNNCVLYKEHDNVHEGIKPFRCVVCSREYAFSSYLAAHQVRYHRVRLDGVLGPNQCSVCHKRFSRNSTLETHMKRHERRKNMAREKKHLCDVCGKGFATKEKLTAHYRVHTGDKPYACSHCPKSFTLKQYLTLHKRVHSGEKPYSCEHCGKCFSQGAPLKIHVRMHTGEKPYVCHICKAGFVSKGILNLHFQNCPGICT